MDIRDRKGDRDKQWTRGNSKAPSYELQDLQHVQNRCMRFGIQLFKSAFKTYGLYYYGKSRSQGFRFILQSFSLAVKITGMYMIYQPLQ
jgi:hypothetical protein